MHQGIGILLVLLLLTPMSLAQTTLTSGKLVATLTPEAGLTDVKLNGKSVFTGTSTHLAGSMFTLLRNTPTRDWNWPDNRTTPHYAPSVGKLVDRLFNTSKHVSSVLLAQPDRYLIEHQYDKGITATFDHQLTATDLKIKITVTNKTPDSFQLDDWLMFIFKCQQPARTTHRMGNYYPSGDNYSPVITISDRDWGVGINWVEHDLRPVQIRLNPMYIPNAWQLDVWQKNSPIPAGGSASYTMILRVDDTPGDWKYLLEPYKKWFNDYFGPVQYNMDFRLKVGVFCAALENVNPGNPMGYYGQLDRQGWFPFLNQQVGHLRKYNIGQIIIWAATGINSRGVNYRPDFDVMPKILDEGLAQLPAFFQSLGNKQFGFFARPNTIVYQQTNAKDSDVSFNPLDPMQLKMADQRYEHLLQAGATAFYMDTYGADWGCFPDSAKGSVFYLKHLRELVGPDALLVTEFGFDAFHVYASIWPIMQDKSGHKPYGEYARWLVPGSVDFCRIFDMDGAQRAWEQGGVPMVNDFAVNQQLMQIQAKYVNADGSSRIRQDCRTSTNQPVVMPGLLPQKNTEPVKPTSPVESLFR